MTFTSFRKSPPASLPPDEGAQGAVFHAPAGFILKSGICGDGLKLVYKIYGKLNAEKTNCILHPTSFDATHPELEFNVGPAKTLDTNRYCVLIVNLLGNGLSTSPSGSIDGGHDQEYPPTGTSICDNVRLQALLLDSLGISEIACIYGYSMGAMQALHWAAMFPQRVKRVAAVCGSAKPSDFNIVFLDSLEAALLADKDCDVSTGWTLRGSCQQGLKAFARIYAGWGVPRQFYQKEIWRKSSRDGLAFSSREDFVTRSYDKGFVNSNPLNLLAQVRTWRQGDICRAHGMPSSSLASVLGRITARVYLMPCTTDSYFNAADIESEGHLIRNCRFLPIESDWGHRAGDPHRPGQEAEADFIKRHVEELLAEEVGNIGDSRVLLGRADGTIVEGPGTDGGLTTDHKPDHPVEVERIERTGGTVQTIMGVPRVNGDLAVSRAFGDSQHKQTGGPKQEDHPVSVEPEFTTLTCDRTDFLVLVCDGISEGSFPNREVVQLAAEELKSKEPAQAAASVCRRALDRGSMDNLSCMIVCFDGKSETKGRVKDLVPGPFTEATHGGFRKAYAAMAERAGMPLEAAVERRYDDISKLDEEASRHGAKENGSSADAKPKEENGQSWAKLLWPMRSMEQGLEDTDSALRELRSELRNFGTGPPKKLAPGSKERTAWFKEWLEGLEVEGGKDPSTMSRDELLNWVEEDPQVLAMARAQGWVGPRAMRRVRIVDADKLRPAIEAHSVIQWDDRLLSVCGQVGKVLQDDETDSTSQAHELMSVKGFVSSD
eukprot:symbB.v1.2.034185.t1/scaffold4372.1/size40542/1